MDYSFKQGEDKKMILEVLDESGGQVDLSVATKIKGNFNVNGDLQKIYSTTPSSDEGTLEIDSVDNWKLDLFVERIDSKNFPIGVIQVALAVEAPNVDFPDGNQVTEYTFSLGSVQAGNTTNIVL